MSEQSLCGLQVEVAMSPLVSFLIPAYNHAQFVEICLDSVLSDRYCNKEIIIINDGSTDNTAAVIENWIKRHEAEIKITFRSRSNKGITATLNELAGLANGEYIRLGASDDYFLPCGTVALVEYLQCHPAKHAVIGDSIVVDNAGKVVYQSGMTELHGARKSMYMTDDGLLRSVISEWAVGGPVPLLRRELITGHMSWDSDLRIDDWDFFLRIAAQRALGFVDVAVCAYRIHDVNTCRTRDVPTRVQNLRESGMVARRAIPLFERPYNHLLQAQSYLADSKVAFLRKEPLTLARKLIGYMIWALIAYGSGLLKPKPRKPN